MIAWIEPQAGKENRAPSAGDPLNRSMRPGDVRARELVGSIDSACSIADRRSLGIAQMNSANARRRAPPHPRDRCSSAASALLDCRGGVVLADHSLVPDFGDRSAPARRRRGRNLRSRRMALLKEIPRPRIVSRGLPSPTCQRPRWYASHAPRLSGGLRRRAEVPHRQQLARSPSTTAIVISSCTAKTSFSVAVVTFCPDVVAGLGVDELRDDANPAAAATHAAFQHVAHAQARARPASRRRHRPL